MDAVVRLLSEPRRKRDEEKSDAGFDAKLCKRSSRLLKKSLRLRNRGGRRDFLPVDAAHF
jgi:hypothetical protein